MIALRLLNTESQDKADYLHNQLITDINVPSTYWECAESYLKGVGIYDVFLIEEQDFRNYKIFLRETGNFTKKQVFERTGFLRNLKKTLIQEEYKELLDEIEQCNPVPFWVSTTRQAIGTMLQQLHPRKVLPLLPRQQALPAAC